MRLFRLNRWGNDIRFVPGEIKKFCRGRNKNGKNKMDLIKSLRLYIGKMIEESGPGMKVGRNSFMS